MPRHVFDVPVRRNQKIKTEYICYTQHRTGTINSNLSSGGDFMDSSIDPIDRISKKQLDVMLIFVLTLLSIGFIVWLIFYMKNIETIQSDPCKYCIDTYNYTCYKMRWPGG